MKFDPRDNSVILTDKYLSSFAQSRQGRSAYDSGGFYSVHSETTVSNARTFSVRIEPFDCPIRLSAEADGIVESDLNVTVEKKTRVKKLPSAFITAYNCELLASGVVTAYACCKEMNIEKISLQLTFESLYGESSMSFRREYRREQLEKLVRVLIDRAQSLIIHFHRHESAKSREIKSLAFPYGQIRSGQQELMLGVMKAFRTGSKLVASAPTGTGKTMATLYPAVKALGERYIDRIFYLTGKTVTGRAALDAMKLLAEAAPHLRCIMLHSKDRSCPDRECLEDCSSCPRMGDSDGGIYLSYKSRRDEALSELLDKTNIFDGKTVSECAERHFLCPFELSLDLSEYCDVIICDYNYVFDSKVQFIRYFKEDRGEQYAFLVDEAHNLPDRVRDAYSVEFSPGNLAEIKKLLSEEALFDEELGKSIESVEGSFDEIAEYCRENASVISDGGREKTVGYYKSTTVPRQLVRSVSELARSCRRIKREHRELIPKVKRVISTASCLTASAAVADEGFAFLAELVDGVLSCRFVCLDPSQIIADMCALARGSVMFSATLDPLDYFTEVLGCSGAPSVRAESPFDPKNLSITIFDGISTRLSDRKDTAADVAEVISTVISAKAGNYFVFFPSYAYMKTVLKEVLAICPDIKAVMQKPHMSHSDREKFLDLFRKRRNIVGFCVLGGVFSEGVDLVGDSLIGVVVVGYGLPGLSSELNLRSEYYEEKYGGGPLYAYEYPAINKLEQAAGRVIRTAEDRGVVILIDHRLSSPDIASKFPDFWPQIAATSETDTLALILSRFWDGQEAYKSKKDR